MANYQNILVAVDFSAASNAVIAKALDMAGKDQSKLTLMHVVEYLPPIDIAYEPVLTSTWNIDENELVEHAKTSLKKMCAEHQLDNTKQIVVIGIPKHEISQYARDQQSDLVIMGSHGRHGLGLLLGSTTNGVLHEMPCDVLAVKITE